MTTTLQQLTAAIVKAVPEIMEWNYGCIVREKKSGKPGTIIMVPDLQPSECGLLVASVLTEEGIEGWGIREETHEILGRPITLEDVLRVISPIEEIEWDFRVDTDGQAWFDHPDVDVPSNEWLLGKPLSAQPPETIDFLHSLLV